MYDPASPLLRVGDGSGNPPGPEAKARFAEDRLLDAVIWCEIMPGDTVTEADVMERFGLTRAAARAGLMRLGYDSWASPQARQGWQILPISGALIGQVLEARRFAEPSLASARLSAEARREMTEIGLVTATLSQRREAGAVMSFRHYVDRVDSLLLSAINPLTARHLRKLWHHSARITRFLEDEHSGELLHRDDIAELIEAVLAEDGDAIISLRLALIDAQEKLFMRQLLQSDAPLSHRSGHIVSHRPTDAATNRRDL